MSPAPWTIARRALTAALALLALAPGIAAAAGGSFFPGVAVDGPSADIRSLGGVELARDGAGLLAYVRGDGGEDHVFVSLLAGGAPLGPFRIDAGQPPVAGRPAVAAGDGGRFAVAWANAAGAFIAVRAADGQAFGAPQQVGGPGSGPPVVDISVNGTGYAAWAENGDLRAAYLPRTQPAFSPYPGPLDADAAHEAGTNDLRPRVAASADGIGLVVWGERDAAGTTHVLARRLVRGAPSAVVADANAATLDGRPGGSADMPDVGFEDDSSYAWVAFRQAVDTGGGDPLVRAVTRRLRGSAFDDPVTIDGAPASGLAGPPRVGINGRGQGVVIVPAPDDMVLATIIRDDLAGAPAPVGAAGPVAAQPVASFAENYDGVLAWLATASPGADPQVQARLLEDDPALAVAPPYGPVALLADPLGGPVVADGGLDADVDRVGDGVIAFVQGAPDQRRISLAVYDRAPSAPALSTTTNWRSLRRPPLIWTGATDLWSGLTYTVLIDGQPAGTIPATSFTPFTPLADGIHRWQVVATDRHGQTARSETHNLRVDATPPKLLVRISGARRPARRLSFSVRAVDLRSPSGSGVRQIRIDFGDRTAPVLVLADRTISRHVFRAGTFTVRISAQDGAGNAVVERRRLKIGVGAAKPKGGAAR